MHGCMMTRLLKVMSGSQRLNGDDDDEEEGVIEI